jgi:CRISPR/Cas system-associated exonuclease Cas4 (RecB family)
MDARRAAGEAWDAIVESAVPDGGPLAALLSEPSWATATPAPSGLWHIWRTLPRLTAIATNEDNVEDRKAWSAFAQALDRLAERAPSATLVDHERLVGHSDFEADPLFDFRLADLRGVTITTLHRSKGTSFEVVYIAQANEGTFPDLRATDSLLGSRYLNPHLPADAGSYRDFRLDEERRLAYTAMTRASVKVVWTASAAQGEHGIRPSRFLPLVAPLTDPDHDTAPLTRRSFEAMLRRTLADPEALDADRLAASTVLANGPEHGLGEPLERYGAKLHGPDDHIVPDALRMSPSQANGYLDCPRRYAVDRYLMTRSDETDHMRFGSLIHKVLEEAERAASQDGRERADADDANAWLDRVWDEYGFGEDAVGGAWRRRAVGMLNDIYRLWPSSGRPVGFETALKMTIDGTPWLGRADRIETKGSSVFVVDYKTGGPVTKADAAESIQLGYYVMAASENPEITGHGEVVGAEFWYPKITNKSSIGTRAFDMANLSTVRERMVEVTSAIHAEQFTPTPGPQCESCAVELVCPARQAGAEAFA